MGQVVNRPTYVAIGVTCSGERDILRLWAGDGGEGRKFGLPVLTEIKTAAWTPATGSTADPKRDVAALLVCECYRFGQWYSQQPFQAGVTWATLAELECNVAALDGFAKVIPPAAKAPPIMATAAARFARPRLGAFMIPHSLQR